MLDTDIFSEIIKGKNEKVIKKATSYLTIIGCYTISAITVEGEFGIFAWTSKSLSYTFGCQVRR